MNGVSFVDFGFSFLSNGIIYSNKTDFLLDPVKGLLDNRCKIRDRVGTQSDFNSVEPSIYNCRDDFRPFERRQYQPLIAEMAVKSASSSEFGAIRGECDRSMT